jgi:hypothetical protein
MYLGEIKSGSMDWIDLAEDKIAERLAPSHEVSTSMEFAN